MQALASLLPGRCQATANTFKRAQRGLYHGKRRIVGNNVSFSQRKTRRHWLPNVQWKKLHSDVLDMDIRMRVTTKALRCIKKAGGLDAYILNTKPHKMQSEFGLALRETLLETMAARAASGDGSGAAAGAGAASDAEVRRAADVVE